MDTLKLLVVFVAILFALKRHLSVGVTLFGAGLLTALLFRVPFADLLDGYRALVTSRPFISLTAVIILITILGSVLKELGYLEKLADACRSLYGGRRTAAALLPPLVGLMPMPGGALLSAPLVDSVLSDSRYSPHFKCAVNYWHRHVVEHFMPIYPGLIVASAMTGLPLGTIAIVQAPLAILMILVGYAFLIRRIDRSTSDHPDFRAALTGILRTVWPVLLAVGIYAIFGIEMAWGALISLLVLILVARPRKKPLVDSLKKGLSYKLVFLVFGILSFQTVLEQSGAIESIQRLSTEYHFPEQLIIILVAFTSGLLTGMLAALVALSYSLLAAFLYSPVIQIDNILLAFLAGYVGMMLSPSHLCLIITNDYFKSDLVAVYKVMTPPMLLFGFLAYLIYLSGWASFVY
ncbi:MAG: DUF401 family protein [candidate division Zixibacteria bacterium]|nr:DUF401 family protein [candidate division Zixibacteria bacterium]